MCRFVSLLYLVSARLAGDTAKFYTLTLALSKMIKVFLREKKLKHGKRSLYLDFYPPIIVDGKPTRREHLKLYIYERPKTETERDHNKETKMLGEHIRSTRQLDLQAGAYKFVPTRHKQKDFVEYFKELCEKKKSSKSNYENWLSVLKHLKGFSGGAVSFGDVTETFCRGFRDYLQFRANLAQNTASLYFDKFRSGVKDARKEKLFFDNPLENLKGISETESQREFLTLAELQQLATAKCNYPDLKNAALFSAMTGLRFSDIEKLTWGEIQQSREQGFYIRFRVKKTGRPETHPISDEAAELLGERVSDADAKVFTDLKDWYCYHYLPDWITAAGITRKITFHAFRHSFATLQITLGTDIYTVSKLLGHKRIETTQIYARIIDEKKREAANRITLK